MLVAGREYLSTVTTKGFILGVLLMPAMMLVLSLVAPWLMTSAPPRVEGEIAVIDPTGVVTQGLRAYLDPDAVLRRRAVTTEQVLEELPEGVRTAAEGSDVTSAMRNALGEVAHLDVVGLTTSDDIEPEKQRLADEASTTRRLALAVVHDNAVVLSNEAATYGTYDLFVGPQLNERIEDEIHDGLADAIVAARVAANNLDRDVLTALLEVSPPPTVTVTADTERPTPRAFNQVIPLAFGMLLLVAVIISGQALLTSTIEEKASRIVEVLLSAVSPLELMTGKILGQLGVGLTVLGLYVALGAVALLSFAMFDLLDVSLVAYLFIFFVLTYVIYGALMAAVGAAVNDMNEAQSLMTPLMLVMVIPFLVLQPITQSPNSVFSTVISLVPPVNTFAMLIRMSSSTPPPLWQVWLTIVISAAAVCAALWVAAKVFRVGLLMHGKPPNLATLVRWIKMA
jgi:ABC-type Na+ efflux pump permease subunit